MSGYLDQYGVGVDRRNRIVAVIATSVITSVVVLSLGWYLLKNHHQEAQVKAFIQAVKRGDNRAAYRFWGCTADKPCAGYGFEKFQEDWSSKNNPPDPAIFGISDSESCSDGVLMTVDVNAARTEKLWVEKATDGIGFAPYPICPHKSPFAIMLHRTIGTLRKPLLK